MPYIQRRTVQAFKILLFRHCYLHKFDTVFVNLKTFEATIPVKNRYRSPLETSFGWKQKFIMPEKTFETIKQILKKRDDVYDI